jgi:hypothetical protein
MRVKSKEKNCSCFDVVPTLKVAKPKQCVKPKILYNLALGYFITRRLSRRGCYFMQEGDFRWQGPDSYQARRNNKDRLFMLNANGENNDRNALAVKFSLDRKDGVVVEHA